MARLTLAITDDHELVARGFQTLLAPHHDILGVMNSGAELLDFLAGRSVQGVLLDLSMPGQSGLEVLPELRRRWPALKILVLTMFVDRSLAEASLSLGADAYLPKDAALPELLGAIDTVFSGRRYVSPLVPRHTERTNLRARHPALASLTPRQERILLLLGEGLSSAEIGKEVGLSEHTITFHRANLRRKLGIENEQGLNRFAVLVRTAAEEADVA